ncbi:MAG: cytochrome C biogenesis protein CycH [Erythrobacter sp.]
MGSDSENASQNGSAEAGGAAGKASGGAKAAWLLLGAAVILAAGSIGYNVMGGPGDDPAASPGEALPPSIAELREAAEAAGDDAKPWGDLAYAYFVEKDFAAAAKAYERAVEIDAGEAVLWSALGESLVYASDQQEAAADPLPPEAVAAFEKAVAIDPSDPRARYFLAVKQDLAGDHEGAIASWLKLLSESPVGAPWERDLVGTIQQVGKINDIDVEARLAKAMDGRLPPIAVPGSGAVAGEAASANVGGPTQEQIAAASSMSAADQQAQIEGMVAMAEEKLKDDPSNLDRWVMVMRSHAMMGNPGKAKATLEAAVAANPENEAGLRGQARSLGVQ